MRLQEQGKTEQSKKDLGNYHALTTKCPFFNISLKFVSILFIFIDVKCQDSYCKRDFLYVHLFQIAIILLLKMFYLLVMLDGM